MNSAWSLQKTQGLQRKTSARRTPIKHHHYRATIFHYIIGGNLCRRERRLDFLKYSCGESQWHDKGVREPGDVGGAITSSACGSSGCWRRAHRSREPRENSRSIITPCVGTGGTMFRRKPAQGTSRAAARPKTSSKRSRRTNLSR